MKCPKCGSEKGIIQKTKIYKDGSKAKIIHCKDCGKYSTIPVNKDQAIVENLKSNGKRGVSLDEIIKTHDVEILIKDGLKKLEPGRLLTEAEFVDMANLRGKYYRTYLEQPDMKVYRGKIDGTMYYGIPSDMETLRQKFIIR